MTAEEFIPKNSNGKYSRNEIVQWAEKYHEAELKKLRVGDVMVELPICISGSSNNFAGICTACGKRH